MADPSALLPFAQLDFPGEVALGGGRFLVRPPGEEAADPDVLVLKTLGASRARSRLRRGRPVPLESEPDPTPLPLTRVTLIKAIPFEGAEGAASWLEQVSGDDELAAGLSAEVAATLNRALEAHRVAAPDRYAADVHAGEAIAIRFGYGTGQEVSEGRWAAAVELHEKRRRSVRVELVDGVGAQERIAAVLGGRDRVLPEESLLIDAERAAAQGRPALSAITLAAALETLARGGGDPGEAGDATSRLQQRALSGTEIDTRDLDQTLRVARRAIRAGRRRS